VSGYTDAELLRRAVWLASRSDARAPRWACMKAIFAIGSSESRELCRRFGVPPEQETPWGGKVADLRPGRRCDQIVIDGAT